MTKNRRIWDLVRRAYQRARVGNDQVLVAWNARIYLNAQTVVMESSCPIFLDKILEQLRIFIGSGVGPQGRLLWVQVRGNRGRRWRTDPLGSASRAETPAAEAP
jgi:hypothetical protein